MFASTKGTDPTSRVKALAFKLRKQHPDACHSHCLHMVSAYLGFRDWNTLSAFIKKHPERVEQILNDKIGVDVLHGDSSPAKTS